MKSMMMTMDKQDKGNDNIAEVEQPKYPYGLRLTLDDEAIETLGITTMPEVGISLSLMAKVKVVGVSATEVLKDDDTTPERRIELQITDMELAAEMKNHADILYGKK